MGDPVNPNRWEVGDGNDDADKGEARGGETTVAVMGGAAVAIAGCVLTATVTEAGVE